MATINIQENPVVVLAGTKDADTTIITSGNPEGGRTKYQIVRRNTQESVIIDTRDPAMLTNGNIRVLNSAELRIILESRTQYRVRTRNSEEIPTPLGPWSLWTNFKTRDKRYQSPEAVTQLTDDTDQTAGSSEHTQNRVINVTNNSKAVVTTTARGATVVNNDTVYNDGQLQRTTTESTANAPHHAVQITDTGANVIAVKSGDNNRILYTDRGATITAE